MINTVLSTIARYGMLQNGDCVLIALSGGADSVSLLHCLYSIKEQYNLILHAAHLHHGIRGEEADRDERFCKILCEKYNIPLHVKHADIPTLAKERKISGELCGRQERYAFFEALAGSLGAKTATAHTASDNAETLLFHLTRGASVMGIAGIPPVRDGIIRPLIACTRADIEAYCQENGLPFVTDSTNFSDAYTRNKIRRQIIPLLKELNPRFEDAALRFCENARATGGYVHAQAVLLLQSAESRFGWLAETLNAADDVVLTEALAVLCENKARFSPEARHLALLKHMLKSGGAVDLGEYTAVCKQQILRFVKKDQNENNLEIPFTGDISFPYRDKLMAATIQNSKKELKSLVFRTRRGGETFTFSKRNLTKPLRKALNEQKIPDEERDSLLLLCQENTVLWCEGLGYSQQGEALKYTHRLNIQTSEKGQHHA